MLITENLLRRMIQYTLTQKILKEQQSSTDSNTEGDESGVAQEIPVDNAIEQEEEQEEEQESDAKFDNILEGELLNDLNRLSSSLNDRSIKDVKIFDDFLDFLGNLLNTDVVWEKFTEIYKLFYNNSEDSRYKKAIKLIFACLNQKNLTKEGFNEFQDNNSAYGFSYTKKDDELVSGFLNDNKKNQIKLAIGLIYSDPDSRRKRTADAKKNILVALKEFRKSLSEDDKFKNLIKIIKAPSAYNTEDLYGGETDSSLPKDSSSTPSTPKQNTRNQSNQSSTQTSKQSNNDSQFKFKDDNEKSKILKITQNFPVVSNDNKDKIIDIIILIAKSMLKHGLDKIDISHNVSTSISGDLSRFVSEVTKIPLRPNNAYRELIYLCSLFVKLYYELMTNDLQQYCSDLDNIEKIKLYTLSILQQYLRYCLRFGVIDEDDLDKDEEGVAKDDTNMNPKQSVIELRPY